MNHAWEEKGALPAAYGGTAFVKNESTLPSEREETAPRTNRASRTTASGARPTRVKSSMSALAEDFLKQSPLFAPTAEHAEASTEVLSEEREMQVQERQQAPHTSVSLPAVKSLLAGLLPKGAPQIGAEELLLAALILLLGREGADQTTLWMLGALLFLDL